VTVSLSSSYDVFCLHCPSEWAARTEPEEMSSETVHVTAWLLLEIWCPEAHAASTHSIAALPAYARLLALNEPLLPLPEGKSIHVAGTEVRSLSDVLLPFPLYLLLAVQVTVLIRFIKKKYVHHL
jgi:hypothetical protein